MTEFKFADSVSMRLVQIFQEAIMTGVDGADLLRQVRLEVDPESPDTLVLTSAYKEQVKASYAKLEAEARALAEARRPKILGLGGDDSKGSN